MIKKILSFAIILLIITISTYNCGYKGPLYLPKNTHNSASSSVKATASSTSRTINESASNINESINSLNNTKIKESASTSN